MSENDLILTEKEKELIKYKRVQEKKKQDYINGFNSMKYDRISFLLPKGYKEILKEKAKEKNLSINAYLKNLVDNDLNIAQNQKSNIEELPYELE